MKLEIPAWTWKDYLERLTRGYEKGGRECNSIYRCVMKVVGWWPVGVMIKEGIKQQDKKAQKSPMHPLKSK